MDPNTLPTQPVPETPQPPQPSQPSQPTPIVAAEPLQQPVVQPQQPLAPQPVVVLAPAKKSKKLIKLLVGVFVLVIVVLSVGTYLIYTNTRNSSQYPIISNDEMSAMAAFSNATAAQQKAEMYAAYNDSIFPARASDLMAGKILDDNGIAIKVPDGVNVIPGAAVTPLNASNGKTSVTWSCLSTCVNTKGGKVTFWDFTTNAVSTRVFYVGDATSSSSFVTPES